MIISFSSIDNDSKRFSPILIARHSDTLLDSAVAVITKTRTAEMINSAPIADIRCSGTVSRYSFWSQLLGKKSITAVPIHNAAKAGVSFFKLSNTFSSTLSIDTDIPLPILSPAMMPPQYLKVHNCFMNHGFVAAYPFYHYPCHPKQALHLQHLNTREAMRLLCPLSFRLQKLLKTLSPSWFAKIFLFYLIFDSVLRPLYLKHMYLSTNYVLLLLSAL